MELKDVLDERISHFSLDAKDKDDALRKMSAMLLHEGYITDLDEFVQDIYEREKLGLTGIGDKIAIPHGKSESVQKIGIAIAKLKEEIEWESIDDDKVNLIFLFCVSCDTEYARNHLLLLSEVARKLGNEDAILKLRNANTFEEVYTVFCS
ncbi:MAG TPA: PTS fructose transporter subunit IIA [Clostridiaceae bacterium]|nr:PTS fructose transporter subunit IIA [Clostridiaceae bacterium]